MGYTKEQLRNKLATQMNHFHDSKEWKEAFNAYNELHGTKLKPNCGRCFQTVREWVQRP